MFREYKVIIISIGVLLVVVLATGYLGPDPAITSYGNERGVVKAGKIKKKAYYDVLYNQNVKDDSNNIPSGSIFHNVYMEPKTQKIDNVTYSPAKTFVQVNGDTAVNYATTIMLGEDKFSIDFANLDPDEAVKVIIDDNHQGSEKLYDNSSNKFVYTPQSSNVFVTLIFYKKNKETQPIRYYEYHADEIKDDFIVTNESKGVIISNNL